MAKHDDQTLLFKFVDIIYNKFVYVNWYVYYPHARNNMADCWFRCDKSSLSC